MLFVIISSFVITIVTIALFTSYSSVITTASSSSEIEMSTEQQQMQNTNIIRSLADFAKQTSYSLLENLRPCPEYKENRPNKKPRQVKSGHYVPVDPTGISNPIYVAHSKQFFDELGLDQSLAQDEEFKNVFSGNLEKLRKDGKLPKEMEGDKTWACGYALSIMGREYFEQCPFGTGNGYGDGRAVSVTEALFPSAKTANKRYEFQLKGGGRTPYCRHADGRAVLRSSIREFLAQEAMYALGIPTSRSLTLYVSKDETVKRPWYSEGSRSEDPDMLVNEPIAISTRVAPSFLRVGQLELFGRRARKKEHPEALKELQMIVQHAIEREYKGEIEIPSADSSVSWNKAYLDFAEKFQDRLTSMIVNWLRVGFVQGNFNADNNAVGGYTLDYGPFGFMDKYDPHHQMWTGGGEHYSFFNQPQAGQQNFKMFCVALMPLFHDDEASKDKLNGILQKYSEVVNKKVQTMYAKKMGLQNFDGDLFQELDKLMTQTPADYTIFFRELSSLPKSVDDIKKSFYSGPTKTVFSSLLRGSGVAMHPTYETDPEKITSQWSEWLGKWHTALEKEGRDQTQISQEMKRTNPKYIPREFLVASAYQEAMKGLSNFSLVRELQEVFTHPYDEQSKEIEEKYYRLKPLSEFGKGGVSHCSCSS